MFEYEYEKRPPSVSSNQKLSSGDWSRNYPNVTRTDTRVTRTVDLERARRPLPPRPICETIPAKTTVPLKVWIIASASCFAVCAVLVLATVVITMWGASGDFHQGIYEERKEPLYAMPNTGQSVKSTTEEDTTTTNTEIEDSQYPILEKLSIFKNFVANRKDRKHIDLTLKPQFHPLHDTTLQHVERKIEKKDKPKQTYLYADDNNATKIQEHFNANTEENHLSTINFNDKSGKSGVKVPEFRPTLPDIFINKHKEIKLPDGYMTGLKQGEYYEDYYNDDNLYEDYIQSNSMTNYLIEKVQELHEWISKDPDFKMHNKKKAGDDFGQLLSALNSSLVDGNISIVMDKLKELYFSDDPARNSSTRRIILTNSTDLLSFGILTLDVMLLHNIQLMAWENQEAVRHRMMQDPDVFAFNALFLDPSKVAAKQNEVYRDDNTAIGKNQNVQESDDFDLGNNLLENVVELGMSTARAAMHLGRAYKNTKLLLNQLSSKRDASTTKQNQLTRDIDGSTYALNHLQTSFDNDSSSATNATFYTELDCVWLLYCKNLVATSKLNAPYGVMARINGMALRMLAGELTADKALHTLVYEALTGWTELKCTDLFPRCSKANTAAVIIESILQPLKKSHSSIRT